MGKKLLILACLFLLAGCGDNLDKMHGEWEIDRSGDESYRRLIAAYPAAASLSEWIRIDAKKKELTQTVFCGSFAPFMAEQLKRQGMECGKPRTINFVVLAEEKDRVEVLDDDQDKSAFTLKDENTLEWVDNRGNLATLRRRGK